MVTQIDEEKMVLVFDATAFYAGIPFGGAAKGCTTPQVIVEVCRDELRAAVVEGALASGKLEVREGSLSRAGKVVETASASGDLAKLSVADISVLALALELKEQYSLILVSDDYAVANVARALGLKHRSAKKDFRLVRWLWYCPGCGKTFHGKVRKICDVCGSEVKRKPLSVRAK
ncbi:MAG: hypothetical protein HYU39_10005 [Thaumarchaeota archaeon]|nr:hypothetical protein [Nitrososphaerota archaeon]